MTTEGKIADLWSTRTELEYQYEKIDRERVVYGRMFNQLMDADEDDGCVRQSLLDWAAMASGNRLSEVIVLQNAIKKINEQIKKQEADDARNV